MVFLPHERAIANGWIYLLDSQEGEDTNTNDLSFYHKELSF